MTSSTTAALEWAAQVSAAAIRTQSTGSLVIAASSARTLGAFSAGASVSSRMCRDKQHQADADRDAPESRVRRPPPRLNADDTNQEQDRRHRGDVERQRLDDERRADIGAEHDGQRRHEIDRAAGHE